MTESIFDKQVPYTCSNCGPTTASAWCIDVTINEHPGICCNCFDEKALRAMDDDCD